MRSRGIVKSKACRLRRSILCFSSVALVCIDVMSHVKIIDPVARTSDSIGLPGR